MPFQLKSRCTHLRSLSNIILPVQLNTALAYRSLGALIRSTLLCNLPLPGSLKMTKALSRLSKFCAAARIGWLGSRCVTSWQLSLGCFNLRLDKGRTHEEHEWQYEALKDEGRVLVGALYPDRLWVVETQYQHRLIGSYPADNYSPVSCQIHSFLVVGVTDPPQMVYSQLGMNASRFSSTQAAISSTSSLGILSQLKFTSFRSFPHDAILTSDLVHFSASSTPLLFHIPSYHLASFFCLYLSPVRLRHLSPYQQSIFWHPPGSGNDVAHIVLWPENDQ